MLLLLLSPSFYAAGTTLAGGAPQLGAKRLSSGLEGPLEQLHTAMPWSEDEDLGVVAVPCSVDTQNLAADPLA